MWFGSREGKLGFVELVDFGGQNEITLRLDTSTPAGKLVFTVLGAVAELERSLIVERVKAGLRNARSKGKKLGRPRVYPDVHRIAALRAEGLSWAKIGERLGVGEGTVYRASQSLAKNHLRQIPETDCARNSLIENNPVASFNALTGECPQFPQCGPTRVEWRHEVCRARGRK